MFVGAVPKPVVEQITRIVPFDEWRRVFIGCSGSFRVDGTIKQAFPDVSVVSNDVSLLSCGLGELLVGRSFALGFKGRLDFIEEQLDGATFRERLAALLVALDMAKYKGANDFAQAHFQHYRANFAEFHETAVAKLDRFLETTRIDEFHGGDFREQARRAAEEGGGIAAFPPTYKAGYERMYKFIDESTEWTPPSYDIWDPAKIGEWIKSLDDDGLRYCILTDHLIDDLEPTTLYETARQKPVYTYANIERSSFRRQAVKSQPFRYKPIEPALMAANSEVLVASADSARMNFLKDEFLAPGIAHASGEMNFLVYVDGMLCGGFIYTRSKFGEHEKIYLISDFSIARERRLSKLIAMLATSRQVVRLFELKHVVHITSVFTTAFTEKPVSMKYRGIYKLAARKPGMLNYQSEIRDGNCQDVYRDWYRRFASGAGNQGRKKKAA